MRHVLKRSSAMFAAAVFAVGALAAPALADTTSTTANGTWTASPGQATTYQTTVQAPINADGSSNFKANGKAVIPVKFALMAGTGPFVFESIGSDQSTANDASYVSFAPSAPVTFSDITGLSSVYAFTDGNCHGGSLRWSVRTSPTQSVFIYYGDYPNFTDCTTVSQSGTSMIGLADLRYDTSQYVGGTFYDTYAHAQVLVGTATILRASLVLDSGWGGDQSVNLSSATFETAAYTDVFTPAPSALSPVCPTDPASIKITKADGTPSGDVNEAISIQPNDTNLTFRIVDCKYIYNLATSSLSGVGTYSVSAVINGTTASNPAVFDLK